MSINLRDSLTFLFNSGRGVRTDQLAGAIVQSITAAGVATLTLANGSEMTVTLARDVVRDNRDPTQADYDAGRLFYDGIELRKIIRIPVPGHDRVVGFAENNLNIALLGTGIYVDRNAASAANPFSTRPTGRRYYNRSLARWELWQVGQYWDTRRSIAEPQSAQGSLWIGEWPTEAAASPHASRVGQITSYPNDAGEYVLHRVASITPGVEDGFRYELDPLFSTYALEPPDIDNVASDVQGTVSGRGIARGVEQHERFTDVEQDILDDLARQTFPHPTDDWRIRQTYAAHDFFTDRSSVFLSLGWDADNRLRALSADGHVGRLGRHDQGRIYDGSETLRAGLISGVHWLYLRDDGAGSAIIRAPVDGGDSDPEFQIVLRYFSMFADPDSGTLLGILRRISSTEMEVGLLAYDAAAGTITAEDTITLTRAHIDAALGVDYAPLPDIHRESATGVYQEVSGAILEGDTLYLLLTDIAKTDGHTASVLVGFALAGTPNNRTLTVLAENAVDELPVSDELTSGILPLEADELFLARPLSVYRLSPESESRTHALDNDDIDDAQSDVQGTISGRGVARGVQRHSPYTADVASAIVAGLNSKADRDLGNLAVTEFVATENIEADAVEKDKLSVNVRNEIDRGGFVASGLQYRINHDETSANDARSTDWVGGVFRVNRDVYMNGGSFRITENSPGTARTYHLSIVKLFEHATDDWRVPSGDPDVPYWDMRINRDGDGFDSDWADHYQLAFGHAAHGYMECRPPNVADPLVIREGEFIGLVSRLSTSGVDEQYYAIGFIGQTDGTGYDDLLDAVVEQDHNHPDFDHEIFTYLGEIHSGHNGRDLQGRPIMTSDNVRNFAYRMTLDYAIHEAELLSVDTDDIEDEAVTEPKLHPDVRAQLGGVGLAGRAAGVLDITDSDDWVETANFDDTTALVGVDRTARYMSWFDGNLYLADAAGAVNTRAIGTGITGMARGDGLFVTGESNNLVSRGAVDLAMLDSFAHAGRIAVAVQQDDPTKFWSLIPNQDATQMAVFESVITADGTFGTTTFRHGISVAQINAVLGATYLDISGIYAPAQPDGIVDLHVVSASEFWIIFTGIPLETDLTVVHTVMVKAEIPDGGTSFELVADSLEVFDQPHALSFVRIGEGLVYLAYSTFSSGTTSYYVGRYEKRSARAAVFRLHQQDRRPRVTEDERDAGAEDGIRDLSPADVHDMIDTHAPAAAGAGGLGRNVLFEDTSDRAVVASNGTPVVLTLDRPPVAGSSMRIELRENSGSTATPVNATYLIDPIPSDLWLELEPISADPTNPNNMMAFILKRPNAAFSTTGLVTYLWVGRVSDRELVVRCGAMVEFNLAFRVTVREILPAGGSSSQQQSEGGGRILRTRSVVAADTLIAANNFNFDLSGDDEIALGRYALNPTPRSDIFDFVATIRVGGRGGIPIRLSREQFDYVGEYDLQNTWPFGGTGGGSWGNVTEIPCAMLYVNHRSEGIVKTQLKPQRQQIRWSMSDPEPATTVLFFFSYNSEGNIDFVEMIVFTDQVVEIEGVHFHYWENA